MTERGGDVPAARNSTERELLAERIAAGLDVPVTVAGLVLVLIVIADNMTAPGSVLKGLWAAIGWGLWALFAAEFLLRLVVAPSSTTFLRQHWWQLVFLVVPFLRFLRAFTRTARLARVASTSVRTTRSAGQALVGRVGWLIGLTITTVLATSELLFEYGPDLTYSRALHAAALGAINGEPIAATGAVADAVEIVLAVHATVVFAALAGALGAFFFERRDLREDQERPGSGT